MKHQIVLKIKHSFSNSTIFKLKHIPNCENLKLKWNLDYIKNKHLPDINSNHVFTVGLLDHVVDGVAAYKRYVDIVPGYNIRIVVVYSVYEHDVRIIRGLRRETQI